MIQILSFIILLSGMGGEDLREGPRPRPAASAGVDRMLPELDVSTIDGRSISLRPTSSESLTTIALTSTTCPLSRKFAPLLGRMSEADQARGIR